MRELNTGGNPVPAKTGLRGNSSYRREFQSEDGAENVL
tara:strand:- start:351 stop:464 length:114 start_codon:yes stop_codon:yes gene_type:complete